MELFDALEGELSDVEKATLNVNRKRNGVLVEKDNASEVDKNDLQDNASISDQADPQNRAYGANNKIVTQERYEELKKQLKGKLNNLNVGFDPEMLSIGLQVASYHIEAGARKFADFVGNMVNEFGDNIRPYLKSFYNGARDLPEMRDYRKDMDTYDNVDNFDIDADVVDEISEKNSNFENSDIAREQQQQEKENGKREVQRTDELRTEREGVQPGERAGELRKESEQDGGRTDGRGEEGDRKQRKVRTGRSLRPVQELKNQHNNRGERGVSYVPKGAEARMQANINAIELSLKIEEEGRNATPEEMATLRQFSGWGGLGSVLTAADARGRKLLELIGSEAYEQVISSSMSSYYTPVEIIDALWDIAEKLGFKGGRILEGSAGIGNILSQIPEGINNVSDILAVEIDSTTGRILSQLYPDADVTIDGFEKTQVENGSIDLAITNVPFVTGLRVHDNTGDSDLSRRFKDIHDFSMAKNIRKLREGGLGIFITSSNTLDRSQKLIEWIGNEGNADIIGAFRLNNSTFEGASVTSDIIVVQKRVNGKVHPMSKNKEMGHTYEERTATVKVVRNNEEHNEERAVSYNQYFASHPEHVGGEIKLRGEVSGNSYRSTSVGVYGKDNNGKHQRDALEKFISDIAQNDRFSREALNNRSEVADSVTGKQIRAADSSQREGQMSIDPDSIRVNGKSRLTIAKRLYRSAHSSRI